MDDQTNPIQPSTDANAGGAQPVGSDTTLPWMNFSADPSAGASAGSGGATGTTSDAGATPAATGSFDPFGNPFAAGDTSSADATAAAFAPSTADGSMQAPAAAFTPTEPSAFTAEPTPAPAPVEQPTPWAADTSFGGSSGAASSHDGEDSLALLASMKAKFDEEEEDFNRQIEDHNANIQFEKEAISKLRSERSDRLAQMREVVRGLEDMLGIKKENKPQDRKEEPRKAERVPSRKDDSGINDFLAA